MRFLIILLLAALVQSSFLPINLVLVFLVCKVMMTKQEHYLTLSFFSGLFLGFLQLINLGFYAIVFLIVSKIAQIFRSSPLSANVFTVSALAGAIFLAVAAVEKLILGISFHYTKIIYETLSALLTCLFIYLWEDRFVSKPLKLRD